MAVYVKYVTHKEIQPSIEENQPVCVKILSKIHLWQQAILFFKMTPKIVSGKFM